MTTNNHQIYYEDEADRQFYKGRIEKALFEVKDFCHCFKCTKESEDVRCPLWNSAFNTCAVDLLELALDKFQKR